MYIVLHRDKTKTIYRRREYIEFKMEAHCFEENILHVPSQTFFDNVKHQDQKLWLSLDY